MPKYWYIPPADPRGGWSIIGERGIRLLSNAPAHVALRCMRELLSTGKCATVASADLDTLEHRVDELLHELEGKNALSDVRIRAILNRS